MEVYLQGSSHTHIGIENEGSDFGHVKIDIFVRYPTGHVRDWSSGTQRKFHTWEVLKKDYYLRTIFYCKQEKTRITVT